MQFTLTGFSQRLEARVFEFEGLDAGRGRIKFTVTADLSLARRYGIRLQELPLLCRSILDRSHQGSEQRVFYFTEAEMCNHARNTAARAESAKQRKPLRRPPSVDEWRTPPADGDHQG